jgi:hypothetical protein
MSTITTKDGTQIQAARRLAAAPLPIPVPPKSKGNEVHA